MHIDINIVKYSNYNTYMDNQEILLRIVYINTLDITIIQDIFYSTGLSRMASYTLKLYLYLNIYIYIYEKGNMLHKWYIINR